MTNNHAESSPSSSRSSTGGGIARLEGALGAFAAARAGADDLGLSWSG